MKQFKRIYIEITNCCNLKCSFCPPSSRPLSFMSLEDFRQVLKKLKGHGQYIYLHIKGEPMLHPSFIEILEMCDQYDLKVNLTTNGTLIQNHLQELLVSKSLRQVSISLQSQENLQDEQAYRGYMDQVLDLIKKGQNGTDIIFELRLWNYDDIGKMTDGQVNNLALRMIKDQLEVSQDVIDAIPRGKGTKLMPQVYLSKSVEFQWPDMTLSPISEVGTCYGLRQQVGILVNGDVVPCCLDGEGIMTLGNIHDQSFEEIVTSDRANAMVAGFENRKIVEGLCQRCGYRSRFDS